jgi:hypothetical protein
MTYHLARLAAVFALFFVGAFVVYAFSQIYVDSGLEGERAERLVTQVNQSITHGDITIRMDWAYADVNRIMLGYTFLDAEGNVFQPESPEYSYQRMVNLREITPHAARNYRTSIMSTGYERIDLNSIEQQIFSWTPYFDYDMPNVLAELESLEVDLRIQIAGQQELYRFLVEIPIYQAQFETTAMLMDGETIDIVLQELTITPSLTNLIFCFQIPGVDVRSWDEMSYWEAVDFSLYFDNQNIVDLYPDLSGEIMTWATYRNEFCTISSLAIPSDVLPETVRLEVYGMHEYNLGRYTEEQANYLVQLYEERGLSATVTEIRDETGQLLGTFAVWSDELYELPLVEHYRNYNEIMRLFHEAFPEIPHYRGLWQIELEPQDPLN